jgi:hypothetical protein
VSRKCRPRSELINHRYEQQQDLLLTYGVEQARLLWALHAGGCDIVVGKGGCSHIVTVHPTYGDGLDSADLGFNLGDAGHLDGRMCRVLNWLRRARYCYLRNDLSSWLRTLDYVPFVIYALLLVRVLISASEEGAMV